MKIIRTTPQEYNIKVNTLKGETEVFTVSSYTELKLKIKEWLNFDVQLFINNSSEEV